MCGDHHALFVMPTPLPNLPIGFRRGWGTWQRDMSTLLAFAKTHFDFVDFGPVSASEIDAIRAAGVGIGSIDLVRWTDLLSSDAAQRREAVAANVAHIRSAHERQVRLFLMVLSPQDPARPRRDNFALAVESLGHICHAVADLNVRIVFEGAPGRPPHYGNLGCTPADLRALFDAVPSPVLGVNFDPSHLVRMGIDPVRFAREFAGRIHHAHAKDTILDPDRLYAHGHLQPPTLEEPAKYAGPSWRYALPARGAVPWKPIFAVLRDHNYAGAISIELEDDDYLGTTEEEQRGLLKAKRFLETMFV